ncbi:tryptophan synthase subunit alpha [Tenacibaculum piscium]|nr:tryptophan synthase subunit alpha [Tenacibaculum piscium]
MNLKSKLVVGFGISDNKTFTTACSYADGAIIGSAFIKDLDKNGVEGISNFVSTVINA